MKASLERFRSTYRAGSDLAFHGRPKDHLINAFFKTIYPMLSWAFLCPPSTKRRCRSGQAHQGPALAISAVCTVLVQRARSRGCKAATWIRTTVQDIWMHLESPTTSCLQTLLIIHQYIETGRFQRVFVLTANAVRFATALHLNHKRLALIPSLSRPVAHYLGRSKWSRGTSFWPLLSSSFSPSSRFPPTSRGARRDSAPR